MKLIKCDKHLINIVILASTSMDERYLMTVKALWIRELEPVVNTMDVYRCRSLDINML